MTKFIWKCPNCETVNDNQDWTSKDGISTCKQCDKPTIDLSEALCIHGHAIDMACDDCPRAGFRFEDDPLRGEWEPNLPADLIEDQLADEGSLDGPGFRCERMKGKTMTEEEWHQIHDAHKGFLRQEYRKEYNEVQPPSYKLYRLICPGCGASLQCMEELEGVD